MSFFRNIHSIVFTCVFLVYIHFEFIIINYYFFFYYYISFTCIFITIFYFIKLYI